MGEFIYYFSKKNMSITHNSNPQVEEAETTNKGMFQ